MSAGAAGLLRAVLRRRLAWACGWALLWPALAGAQPATAGVPAPAAAAASLPGPAAACPPAAVPLDPATIPQGLRRAQDRGVLWRVEQGGRTSWLYGTVHAAYRDWMLPGPQVLAAVRASDRVALELDLLDPAVGQALVAAMRQPPNAPPLPPALERRLDAQRTAACAEAGLAELRPELQVVSLAVMAAQWDGIDAAYGTDFVLAGLARGLRKPVVSLETPEQQMQALTSDDPVRTVAAVEAGLQALEGGSVRGTLRTLVQAWSDGRTQLLENYGSWCQCMDTAEEREDFDRLVTGRNPGLADAIAAQHRAGQRVFAAVGALHMVGPQGLPTLLAARGFRVERVRFAATAPASASAPDSPSKGPPRQ